eukprot:668939-Karenia_brevis.AAC.1
MDICRSRAVQSIQKTARECKGEVGQLEDRMLELVELAKQSVRSPRTRFEDRGAEEIGVQRNIGVLETR